MRKYIWLMACLVAFAPLSANAAKKHKKAKKAQTELWPDGTKMDAWFCNAQKVNVDTLGKKYVITDYGVKNDSTLIQTQAIQTVIDQAAKDGGGVIVVPAGTYQSGALFFRPKTHLYLEEGGKLKGSDRIANFPVLETRIEGETCKYFSAFINADKCDGFTIAGKEPSMVTAITTGRNSGYVVPGTASVPTRMHSVHDSYISAIQAM